MAPTYRDRLRAEGLVLAGVGVAGSALLLATREQSKRMPLNTIGQLVLLGVGLARLGPRSTAKAMGAAQRVEPSGVGTGEPTPLWHVPVPVIAQTLFFAKVAGVLAKPLPLPPRLKDAAGWDAGLRVTAGSALVGAYQALGVARQVAADEAVHGRTYFRMPGSRLGSGTVLGYTEP